MSEWQQFEGRFRPTLRWRIRKAWEALRTGNYAISLSYRFDTAPSDETDLYVFVDDEAAIAVEKHSLAKNDEV